MLPVQPVTCQFYDQKGSPVAFATGSFKLTRREFYEGVIAPAEVEFKADANGFVVVSMFPNELGSQGSQYKVKVTNPNTGSKFLDALVTVPNAPCDLQEIVTDMPYPAVDASLAALQGAQAAASAARINRLATDENAQQSSDDRIQTGLDRLTAGESADDAADQVVLASQQVTLAATQVGLATTNGAAQVTLAAAQVTLAGNQATAAAASRAAIDLRIYPGTYSEPSPTVRPSAAGGGVIADGDEFQLTAALGGARRVRVGGSWTTPAFNQAQLAAPYSNLTKASGADNVGVRNSTATPYLVENDTRPLSYKVGPFLRQLKLKPCRVFLCGTSISSFDSSAIQVLIPLLQNAYGKNGSAVQMMGALGGTYGPSGGHKKQPFGGPGYVRLSLAVGEADVAVSGVIDSFNLIYGKESGGGSFDVYVDGAFDVTLSSDGSQSSENVYTRSFSTRAYRTVTIKPPTASGVVFIERVEMLQSDAGVFVENATLGGSGLRHAFTLLDTDAANRPGIPIVGNNGIDAFCNRSGVTKPDLMIVQHFTNDGDLPLFSAGIARIVERTKALGIPLILISEMPALVAVSDGVAGEGLPGTLKTTRIAILAEILKYRNEKHVTVIDWTEMVDFSNKSSYEAKFFPTADKTHPTIEGHSLLMGALAPVFGLQAPRQQSAASVVNEYQIKERSSAMPFPALTDDIYSTRSLRPGMAGQLRGDPLHSPETIIIGTSTGLYGTTASLHYSQDVPNIFALSSFDAIKNSTTKDKFGSYVAFGVATDAGAFRPMHGIDLESEYTVVILARKNSYSQVSSIAARNGFNNAQARFLVEGVVVGTGSALLASKDGADPSFMHVVVKHGTADSATGALSITLSALDVYGIWVVQGRVPVVTTRFSDTYRQIGFPMFMAGDAVPDDATVGQTYLESINSATIEKVALKAVCWKPLQGQFARVYEMRGKGALIAERMLPLSPGALTYNSKRGGLTAASATGYRRVLTMSGLFGKTFTLGLRGLSASGIRIILFGWNGSANTTTTLKPDGAWITGSTFIAIPIGSIFSDGLNIAITFQLPDASFSASLGATPELQITSDGAASNWAPAFLCEGSSACVGATA